MEEHTRVIEYKCPCCGAGLLFGGEEQLKCQYCDNTFDINTVKAVNESEAESKDEISWEHSEQQQWKDSEQEAIRAYQCPSCGGEIVTDAHTAATFCPFCDNPAIMPSRLTGTLRPDALLPFCNSKEDAKTAFLKLCKGKPLLPKGFTSEQRVEKITGMYVPFWLYDCDTDFHGNYKATRIHRWSDTRYHYTKTDHFLLRRMAKGHFSGIPMDGSSKMDDTFMESIEPFDYGKLVDFDMAYLSGFFADKYDVPSEMGENRIRQRVERTVHEELQKTMLGYASVIPTGKSLNIHHSKARYVLLPVWMLNTKYRDKIYTFAMNGQTGKMTGTFPVCPKRTAAWFAGICTGVTILATLFQILL